MHAQTSRGAVEMIEMTVKRPGTWPERPGPARPTRDIGSFERPTRVPRQREPGGQSSDDRIACSWCGARITRHQEQYAVLWDSSAIHPTEAGMDGRRLLAACGSEHVRLLRASARPWVDEELWAGRLARAERGGHGRPTSTHALAHRAGISVEQMQRALAWRRAHSTPDHHR
jgi:hypothetical protein